MTDDEDKPINLLWRINEITIALQRLRERVRRMAQQDDLPPPRKPRKPIKSGILLITAFIQATLRLREPLRTSKAGRARGRTAPGRPGSRPASQASSRSRPASFLGLQTGKVWHRGGPEGFLGCSTTRPSPLVDSRTTAIHQAGKPC